VSSNIITKTGTRITVTRMPMKMTITRKARKRKMKAMNLAMTTSNTTMTIKKGGIQSEFYG
jgi:hypothetical protein